MADPITVVGAIASVVQLIDFSARVLIRLNDYRAKCDDLPSAFTHIASQLPILRRILEKSKEAIEKDHISAEDAKALEPCLQGCRQQLEELDTVLLKILPEAQDTSRKRAGKAIRCLWKESDIRKIDDELQVYVSRLTFYCTWSSSKLDPRNGKQSPCVHPIIRN